MTDTHARIHAPPPVVNVLASDGDPKKLEFQLRRALEVDPDGQSSFSTLQKLLCDHNEAARFALIAEHLIAKTRDQYLRAARLGALGDLWERAGDLQSALLLHERALQIDP